MQTIFFLFYPLQNTNVCLFFQIIWKKSLWIFISLILKVKFGNHERKQFLWLLYSRNTQQVNWLPFNIKSEKKKNAIFVAHLSGSRGCTTLTNNDVFNWYYLTYLFIYALTVIVIRSSPSVQIVEVEGYVRSVCKMRFWNIILGLKMRFWTYFGKWDFGT